MPELSGIELAKRFKLTREGFPIMLYSGYVDSFLDETIKAAGLRKAVPKPLTIRELKNAVREAVGVPHGIDVKRAAPPHVLLVLPHFIP